MVVLIGLIGLALGSFVNALVWRLNEGKDWIRGRSECTQCKHTLAWYDLVPVVSWILLGAKCRYCKARIAWQYPLVELGVALAAVLSYLYWPYGDLTAWRPLVLFGLWGAVLTIGAALLVYDLRWMILPDRLNLALFTVSLLFTLLAPRDTVWWASLLNTLAAIGICSGIFYVLFAFSNGKAIGGGDVKMGIALGLLAQTPVMGMMLIGIASLIGTLIALPLMAFKKARFSSRLPFGPFLLIAVVIVVLFGGSMLEWYTTMSMLVPPAG